MVEGLKRLGYSFVSMLIAASVCGTFLEGVELHSAHFAPWEFLMAIWTVFALSLPGWLLAMPIILTVRNFRGRRKWFFFAVGACIGPIVILGLEFGDHLNHPHPGLFWLNPGFLFLSTADSCITTWIYLTLVGRARGLGTSN
jgi:hypothetical protein